MSILTVVPLIEMAVAVYPEAYAAYAE